MVWLVRRRLGEAEVSEFEAREYGLLEGVLVSVVESVRA